MILLDLLALVIVCALIYGVVCVVNWARQRLDGWRAEALDLRVRLRSADRRILADEKVFRSIANNAGNPVLEAEIALDEIAKHIEDSIPKELN